MDIQLVNAILPVWLSQCSLASASAVSVLPRIVARSRHIRYCCVVKSVRMSRRMVGSLWEAFRNDTFGPFCYVLLLPAAAFPSVALHFEVGSYGRGLREEVLSRCLDFSAQHIAEGGWVSWDEIMIESKDSIVTKMMFRLSCEAVLCDVAAILPGLVENKGRGWEVLVMPM
jgi:hypothetical protein